MSNRTAADTAVSDLMTILIRPLLAKLLCAQPSSEQQGSQPEYGAEPVITAGERNVLLARSVAIQGDEGPLSVANGRLRRVMMTSEWTAIFDDSDDDLKTATIVYSGLTFAVFSR